MRNKIKKDLRNIKSKKQKKNLSLFLITSAITSLSFSNAFSQTTNLKKVVNEKQKEKNRYKDFLSGEKSIKLIDLFISPKLTNAVLKNLSKQKIISDASLGLNYEVNLKDLQKLKTLNLTNLGLNDLNAIFDLKIVWENLVELDLSKNDLSESKLEINSTNFPNLKTLKINNAKLKQTPDLSSWSEDKNNQLINLDLSNNQITKLDSYFNKLVFNNLDLSNNQLSALNNAELLEHFSQQKGFYFQFFLQNNLNLNFNSYKQNGVSHKPFYDLSNNNFWSLPEFNNKANTGFDLKSNTTQKNVYKNLFLDFKTYKKFLNVNSKKLNNSDLLNLNSDANQKSLVINGKVFLPENNNVNNLDLPNYFQVVLKQDQKTLILNVFQELESKLKSQKINIQKNEKLKNKLTDSNYKKVLIEGLNENFLLNNWELIFFQLTDFDTNLLKQLKDSDLKINYNKKDLTVDLSFSYFVNNKNRNVNLKFVGFDQQVLQFNKENKFMDVNVNSTNFVELTASEQLINLGKSFGLNALGKGLLASQFKLFDQKLVEDNIEILSHNETEGSILLNLKLKSLELNDGSTVANDFVNNVLFKINGFEKASLAILGKVNNKDIATLNFIRENIKANKKTLFDALIKKRASEITLADLLELGFIDSNRSDLKNLNINNVNEHLSLSANDQEGELNWTLKTQGNLVNGLKPLNLSGTLSGFKQTLGVNNQKELIKTRSLNSEDSRQEQAVKQDVEYTFALKPEIDKSTTLASQIPPSDLIATVHNNALVPNVSYVLESLDANDKTGTLEVVYYNTWTDSNNKKVVSEFKTFVLRDFKKASTTLRRTKRQARANPLNPPSQFRFKDEYNALNVILNNNRPISVVPREDTQSRKATIYPSDLINREEYPDLDYFDGYGMFVSEPEGLRNPSSSSIIDPTTNETIIWLNYVNADGSWSDREITRLFAFLSEYYYENKDKDFSTLNNRWTNAIFETLLNYVSTSGSQGNLVVLGGKPVSVLFNGHGLPATSPLFLKPPRADDATYNNIPASEVTNPTTIEVYKKLFSWHLGKWRADNNNNNNNKLWWSNPGPKILSGVNQEAVKNFVRQEGTSNLATTQIVNAIPNDVDGTLQVSYVVESLDNQYLYLPSNVKTITLDGFLTYKKDADNTWAAFQPIENENISEVKASTINTSAKLLEKFSLVNNTTQGNINPNASVKYVDFIADDVLGTLKVKYQILITPDTAAPDTNYASDTKEFVLAGFKHEAVTLDKTLTFALKDSAAKVLPSQVSANNFNDYFTTNGLEEGEIKIISQPFTANDANGTLEFSYYVIKGTTLTKSKTATVNGMYTWQRQVDDASLTFALKPEAFDVLPSSININNSPTSNYYKRFVEVLGLPAGTEIEISRIVSSNDATGEWQIEYKVIRNTTTNGKISSSNAITKTLSGFKDTTTTVESLAATFTAKENVNTIVPSKINSLNEDTYITRSNVPAGYNIVDVEYLGNDQDGTLQIWYKLENTTSRNKTGYKLAIVEGFRNSLDQLNALTPDEIVALNEPKAAESYASLIEPNLPPESFFTSLPDFGRPSIYTNINNNSFNDKNIKMVSVYFNGWSKKNWTKLFQFLSANPDRMDFWLTKILNKINEALRQQNSQLDISWYNTIVFGGSPQEAETLRNNQGFNRPTLNLPRDITMLGGYFYESNSNNLVSYLGINQNSVMKHNYTFQESSTAILKKALQRNIGEFPYVYEPEIFSYLNWTLPENVKIKYGYFTNPNDETGEVTLKYKLIDQFGNISDWKTKIFNGFLSYKKEADSFTPTFGATALTNTVLPSQVNAANWKDYVSAWELPKSYEYSDLVFVPNDASSQLTIRYKIQRTGTSIKSEEKTSTVITGWKTINQKLKETLDNLNVVFSKKSSVPETDYASTVNLANFSTKIENNVPSEYTLNISNVVANDITGVLSFDYTLSKDGITSSQKYATISNWANRNAELAKQLSKLRFAPNPSKPILPSKIVGDVNANAQNPSNWKDHIDTSGLPEGYHLKDVEVISSDDAAGTVRLRFKVTDGIVTSGIDHYTIRGFPTKIDYTTPLSSSTVVGSQQGLTKFPSTLTTTNKNDFTFTIPSGYSLNEITNLASPNDATGTVSISFTIKKDDSPTLNVSDPKTVNLTGFWTYQKEVNAVDLNFAANTDQNNTSVDDITDVATLNPKINVQDYIKNKLPDSDFTHNITAIQNRNPIEGSITVDYTISVTKNNVTYTSPTKTTKIFGFANFDNFESTEKARLKNVTPNFAKKDPLYDIYGSSAMNPESTMTPKDFGYFFPTTVNNLPVPTLSLVPGSTWSNTSSEPVNIVVNFAGWTPEDWKQLFSYLKAIQSTDQNTFNTWINKIATQFTAALNAKRAEVQTDVNYASRLYQVRFDAGTNDALNLWTIGGYGYDSGIYNEINSTTVMDVSWKLASEQGFKNGIIRNLGQYANQLYTPDNNPARVVQDITSENSDRILNTINVTNLTGPENANTHVQVLSWKPNDVDGIAKMKYFLVTNKDGRFVYSDIKSAEIPNYLWYKKDLDTNAIGSWNAIQPKASEFLASQVTTSNLSDYATQTLSGLVWTKNTGTINVTNVSGNNSTGELTITYTVSLVVSGTTYTSEPKTATVPGFKTNTEVLKDTLNSQSATFTKSNSAARTDMASAVAPTYNATPVFNNKITVTAPNNDTTVNIINATGDDNGGVVSITYTLTKDNVTSDSKTAVVGGWYDYQNQVDDATIEITNKATAISTSLSTVDNSNFTNYFNITPSVPGLSVTDVELIDVDNTTGTGIFKYKLNRTSPNLTSSAYKYAPVSGFKNLKEELDELVTNITGKDTVSTIIASKVNDTNKNTYLNFVAPTVANTTYEFVDLKFQPNDESRELVVKYKVKKQGFDYLSNEKTATIPSFSSVVEANQRFVNEGTATFSKTAAVPSSAKASQVTNTGENSNYTSWIAENKPTGTTVQVQSLSANDNTGVLTINYKLAMGSTVSEQKTATIENWSTPTKELNEVATQVRFTNKPIAIETLPSQVTEDNYTTYLNVLNLAENHSLTNVSITDKNDSNGSFKIKYKITKAGSSDLSDLKEVTINNFLTTENKIINALNKALETSSVTVSDLGTKSLPTKVIKSETNKFNFSIPENYLLNEIVSVSNQDNVEGSLEIEYNIKPNTTGSTLVSKNKITKVTGFFTNAQDLSQTQMTGQKTPVVSNTLASSVTKANLDDYVSNWMFENNQNAASDINKVVNELNANDLTGTLEIIYSLSVQQQGKTNVTAPNKILTVRGFLTTQQLLNNATANFTKKAESNAVASEVTPDNYVQHLNISGLPDGVSLTKVNITDYNDQLGSFTIWYKTTKNGLESGTAKSANVTGFTSLLTKLNSFNPTFVGKPGRDTILASELRTVNFNSNITTNDLADGYYLDDFKFTANDATGTLTSFTYKIKSLKSPTLTSSEKTWNTPINGFKTTAQKNSELVESAGVTFNKKPAVNGLASQVTTENVNEYVDINTPTGTTVNVTNATADDETGILTLTYTVSKDGSTSTPKTVRIPLFKTNQDVVNQATATFSLKETAANVLASTVTSSTTKNQVIDNNSNYSETIEATLPSDQYKLVDFVVSSSNDEDGRLNFTYKLQKGVYVSTPKTSSLTGYLTTAQKNANELESALNTSSVVGSQQGLKKLPSQLLTTRPTDFSFTLPDGYSLGEISALNTPNDVAGTVSITYKIIATSRPTQLSNSKTVDLTGFTTATNYGQQVSASWTALPSAATVLPQSLNLTTYLAQVTAPTLSAENGLSVLSSTTIEVTKLGTTDDTKLDIHYKVKYSLNNVEYVSNEKVAKVPGFASYQAAKKAEIARLDGINVNFGKKYGPYDIYPSSIIDPGSPNLNVGEYYVFPTSVENLPVPTLTLASGYAWVGVATNPVNPIVHFEGWKPQDWKNLFSYLATIQNTDPETFNAWINKIVAQFTAAFKIKVDSGETNANYGARLYSVRFDDGSTEDLNLWTMGGYGPDSGVYNGINANTIMNGYWKLESEQGLKNAIIRNLGQYQANLYTAATNPAKKGEILSNNNNYRVLNHIELTPLSTNAKAIFQVVGVEPNDVSGDLKVTYQLVSKNPLFKDVTSNKFSKVVPNFLSYQKDVDRTIGVWPMKESAKTTLPSAVTKENIGDTTQNVVLENHVSPDMTLTITSLSANDATGVLTVNYTKSIVKDQQTYSSTGVAELQYKSLNKETKKLLDSLHAVFTKKASVTAQEFASSVSIAADNNNFDTKIQTTIEPNEQPTPPAAGPDTTGVSKRIIAIDSDDEVGYLKVSYELVKDNIVSNTKYAVVPNWNTHINQVNSTTVTWATLDTVSTINPSQITNENYATYLTNSIPLGLNLADVQFLNKNDLEGSLEVSYKVTKTVGSKTYTSQSPKIQKLSGFKNLKATLNAVEATISAKDNKNTIIPSVVNNTNKDTYLNITTPNGYELTDLEFVPNDETGNLILNYKVQKQGANNNVKSDVKTKTLSGFLTNQEANQTAVNNAVATFAKQPGVLDTEQASSVVVSGTNANFNQKVISQTALEKATINVLSALANNKTGTLTISYNISRNGYQGETKTATVSGWYTEQNKLDATTVYFTNKPEAKTTAPSTVNANNYATSLNVNGLLAGANLVDVTITNSNDATGTFDLNYKVAWNGLTSTNAKTANISGFLTTTLANQKALETALLSTTATASETGKQKLANTLVASTPADFSFSVPTGYELHDIQELTNPDNKYGTVIAKIRIKSSADPTLISNSRLISVPGFYTNLQDAKATTATWTVKEAAATALASDMSNEAGGKWADYLTGPVLANNKNVAQDVDVMIDNLSANNSSGELTITYQVLAGKAGSQATSGIKTATVSGFMTLQKMIDNATANFTNKVSAATTLATQVTALNYGDYLNVTLSNPEFNLTDVSISDASENAGTFKIHYKVTNGVLTSATEKEANISNFQTLVAKLNSINPVVSGTSAISNIKASDVNAENKDTYLTFTNIPVGYEITDLAFTPNDANATLNLTYKVQKVGNTDATLKSSEKNAAISGFGTPSEIDKNFVNSNFATFSKKPTVANTMKASQVQKPSVEQSNYDASISQTKPDNTTINVLSLTPNDLNGTLTINYTLTKGDQTSLPKFATVSEWYTNLAELQAANPTLTSTATKATTLPSTITGSTFTSAGENVGNYQNTITVSGLRDGLYLTDIQVKSANDTNGTFILEYKVTDGVQSSDVKSTQFSEYQTTTQAQTAAIAKALADSSVTATEAAKVKYPSSASTTTQNYFNFEIKNGYELNTIDSVNSPNNAQGTVQITYTIKNSATPTIVSSPKTVTVSGLLTYEKDLANTTAAWTTKDAATSSLASIVNSSNTSTYLNNPTQSNNVATDFSVEIDSFKPNDDTGTLTITYKLKKVENETTYQSTLKTTNVSGFSNSKTVNQTEKARLNALNPSFAKKEPIQNIYASSLKNSSSPDISLENPTDTITTRLSDLNSANVLNALNITNLPENSQAEIQVVSITPNDVTGILEFKYQIKSTKPGYNVFSDIKDASVNNFLTHQLAVNGSSTSWLIKPEAARVLANVVTKDNLNTYASQQKIEVVGNLKNAEVEVESIENNLAEGSITINYKIKSTIDGATYKSDAVKTQKLTGFKTQANQDLQDVNQAAASFTKKPTVARTAFASDVTFDAANPAQSNKASFIEETPPAGMSITIASLEADNATGVLKIKYTLTKNSQTSSQKTALVGGWYTYQNQVDETTITFTNKEVVGNSLANVLTPTNYETYLTPSALPSGLTLSDLKVSNVDVSTGRLNFGYKLTNAAKSVVSAERKFVTVNGFKTLSQNLNETNATFATTSKASEILASQLTNTNHNTYITNTIADGYLISDLTYQPNDANGSVVISYKVSKQGFNQKSAIKTAPALNGFKTQNTVDQAMLNDQATVATFAKNPTVSPTLQASEITNTGANPNYSSSIIETKPQNTTVEIVRLAGDNTTGVLTITYKLVKGALKSSDKTATVSNWYTQQDKLNDLANSLTFENKPSALTTLPSEVSASNYTQKLSVVGLSSSQSLTNVSIESVNDAGGNFVLKYKVSEGDLVSNFATKPINNFLTALEKNNQELVKALENTTVVASSTGSSKLPSSINNNLSPTNFTFSIPQGYELNNLVSVNNPNDNTGSIEITYTIKKANTNLSSEPKKQTVANFFNNQNDVNQTVASWTINPTYSVASKITLADINNQINGPTFTNNLNNPADLTATISAIEPNDAAGTLKLTYTISTNKNNQKISSILKTTTITGYDLLQTMLNNATANFTNKQAAANTLPSEVSPQNYADSLTVLVSNPDFALNVTRISDVNNLTGTFKIWYKLTSQNLISSNEKSQDITGFATLKTHLDSLVATITGNAYRNQVLASSVTRANATQTLNISTPTGYEAVDLEFSSDDQTGTLTVKYNLVQKGVNSRIKSEQKTAAPIVGYLTAAQATASAVETSEATFSKANSVSATELASSVIFDKTKPNESNFDNKVSAVVPLGMTLNLESVQPNDDTGQLTITYTLTKDNKTSTPKQAVVSNWYTNQQKVNAVNASFVNKPQAKQMLASQLKGDIDAAFKPLEANYTQALEVNINPPTGYMLINVSFSEVNDTLGSAKINYQISSIDGKYVSSTPKQFSLTGFKTTAQLQQEELAKALENTTVVPSATGATKVPTRVDKNQNNFEFVVPAGYELKEVTLVENQNNIAGSVQVRFKIQKPQTAQNPLLVSNEQTTTVTGFKTLQADVNETTVSWTALPSAATTLVSDVNLNNFTSLVAAPVLTNYQIPNSEPVIENIQTDQADPKGVIVTYKVRNGSTISQAPKTAKVTGFLSQVEANNQTSADLNTKLNSVNMTKKPNMAQAYGSTTFDASDLNQVLEQVNVSPLIQPSDNYKLTVTSVVPNDVTGELSISFKLVSIQPNTNAESNIKTVKVPGFLTHQQNVDDATTQWSPKTLAGRYLSSVVKPDATNLDSYTTQGAYKSKGLLSNPEAVDLSVIANEAAGTIIVNYKIKQTVGANSYTSTNSKQSIVAGFMKQSDYQQQEVNDATAYFNKTPLGAKALPSEVQIGFNSNFNELLTTSIADGFDVAVTKLIPNDTAGSLTIEYTVSNYNLTSGVKTAVVTDWTNTKTRLDDFEVEFATKPEARLTLASTLTVDNYLNYLTLLNLAPNYELVEVSFTNVNDPTGTFDLNYKLKQGELISPAKTAKISGFKSSLTEGLYEALEKTNVVVSDLGKTKRPSQLNVLSLNDFVFEIPQGYALDKIYSFSNQDDANGTATISIGIKNVNPNPNDTSFVEVKSTPKQFALSGLLNIRKALNELTPQFTISTIGQTVLSSAVTGYSNKDGVESQGNWINYINVDFVTNNPAQLTNLKIVNLKIIKDDLEKGAVTFVYQVEFVAGVARPIRSQRKEATVVGFSSFNTSLLLNKIDNVVIFDPADNTVELTINNYDAQSVEETKNISPSEFDVANLINLKTPLLGADLMNKFNINKDNIKDIFSISEVNKDDGSIIVKMKLPGLARPTYFQISNMFNFSSEFKENEVDKKIIEIMALDDAKLDQWKTSEPAKILDIFSKLNFGVNLKPLAQSNIGESLKSLALSLIRHNSETDSNSNPTTANNIISGNILENDTYIFDLTKITWQSDKLTFKEGAITTKGWWENGVWKNEPKSNKKELSYKIIATNKALRNVPWIGIGAGIGGSLLFLLIFLVLLLKYIKRRREHGLLLKFKSNQR